MKERQKCSGPLSGRGVLFPPIYIQTYCLKARKTQTAGISKIISPHLTSITMYMHADVLQLNLARTIAVLVTCRPIHFSIFY